MAPPSLTDTSHASVAGRLRRRRGAFGLRFLAAAILVLVAFQVLDRGALLGIDREVRADLGRHRVAGLDEVMTVATLIATPSLMIVTIVAMTAVATWRARQVRPLVLGLTAVGLFAVTVGTAKLLVGRARPPLDPGVLHAGGASFPSGHTTGFVIMAGCVLLLLRPSLSTAAIWSVSIGSGVASVIVAGSRLYLDQHWFTDVLASIALGVLILSMLSGVTDWALGQVTATRAWAAASREGEPEDATDQHSGREEPERRNPSPCRRGDHGGRKKQRDVRVGDRTGKRYQGHGEQPDRRGPGIPSECREPSRVGQPRDHRSRSGGQCDRCGEHRHGGHCGTSNTRDAIPDKRRQDEHRTGCRVRKADARREVRRTDPTALGHSQAFDQGQRGLAAAEGDETDDKESEAERDQVTHEGPATDAG